MKNEDFSALEWWKGIVLYGLNNATYKIALGQCLLDLANSGHVQVRWEELSEAFFDVYLNRIHEKQMPQLSSPERLTVMERIVKDFDRKLLTRDEAIETVRKEAFKDVIPRFHSIGNQVNAAQDRFYRVEGEKGLWLQDDLFEIENQHADELRAELDTRWGLLEGAFLSAREHWGLANDIREVYLMQGYARKPLTSLIPFLQGYQGNLCFYCGEPMASGDIHVDHVL